MIFVHYMLDEAYLLQKMRTVDAIQKLPSSIRDAIERINALRNAIAHSFFPENRRQYARTKKVTYGKSDIFTKEGLEKMHRDFHVVSDYLWSRGFGINAGGSWTQ